MGMETILDKLIELVPLWIIIVFIIMFYGFKFYYTRFKTLEDKIDKADCNGNAQKIDKLASGLSDVKNDLEKVKRDVTGLKQDVTLIRQDIDKIVLILANKFPKTLDLFGMKKSPRRLNPMGEKLFNDIQGEKFLNENKNLFFEYIDKECPKTALDVETVAFLACNALSANEIFNDIKSFVYNSPEMEVEDRNGEKLMYEITMGDICFILGIPLRDMYLNEHPEIIK